ncbi:MAG: hypothetical protein GOMPHAMPRED_005255 [Gomphillus americanus]|uniref:Uncharacterized protein n=1 Tax=Gomphillus americanus TaxID=1940652 RepID=A0A8H3FTQ0_9LECA|nr:MAG: hypothetical protein GOMPHAMPRED_005255 [Gomphillus americanus]
MSLDPRKPINNGKPVAPGGPIRSKSSPYFTPKLANANASTPGPELRRNGIGPKGGNGNNITPPLKTILTSNITPRSSSRTSRAGSASSTPNSTPNGTPVGSRPVSFTVPFENSQGPKDKNEADIARFGKAESVLSNGLSSTRNARSAETKAWNEGNAISPMFFHASDATSVPKKPSISSGTGTSFVYADGRQEDLVTRQNIPTTSKPGSQVGAQPKVYHANGRPKTSLKMNASTNNISPTTSPILSPHTIPPRFDQKRQRSTSPLKDFEVPGQSLPSTRRTSGASNLSLQSVARTASIPQSTTPTSSVKHADIRTHLKTQSMSLLEACTRPNPVPDQSDLSLSGEHSIQTSHDTQSTSSFFTMQNKTTESISTPTSPLTSPGHAGSSAREHKIDQLNAMAANARRERKVLDLEISNSSLLAINRTLEKEMRKQKAELRRFRRLTSGVRLSIIPNQRSVSGATTISTVSTLSIDSDLSSASDQETILTDVQSDEESEASDDSSLSLSPEAQAARELRQRRRDETRLQVDLSRHRQILIDSQKMNESLKRCLGWTDELILEGKRALEYQIRVNEIAIGGRVLHEDENPEMQDASPRLGLLSPTDYLKDTDEFFPTSTPSSEGATDHG